jgi:hypothetical protein
MKRRVLASALAAALAWLDGCDAETGPAAVGSRADAAMAGDALVGSDANTTSATDASPKTSSDAADESGPGLDGGAEVGPTGGGRTAVDWADAWLAGWTGAGKGTNVYAHESAGVPLVVQWGSDPGTGGLYLATSDCSFFGAHTFERAYGWTDAGLVDWLCGGSCPAHRPQAVHFHDAIVAGDHFADITDVEQIQRNDVVAIKYLDYPSATPDTGHFMLARAAPTVLCASCSPVEYALAIDDSADGYHGTADARYIAHTCTTDADCSTFTDARCDGATGHCSYTGIGTGTLRLLADGSHTLVGYSWSTASASTRYLLTDTPQTRIIAVGRYDGAPGH